MANLQGRYSVDFRFNPEKNFHLGRNTVSSQSNAKKVLNKSKLKGSHNVTTKKKRSHTQSRCVCKTASLNNLYSTIVKLEKEKSVHGSHLQQISRITKIINELNYVPSELCHKLIRVIISKQLTQIFPQVGRLINSIIDVLGLPKGDQKINNLLTEDIRKLENELQDLRQEEQQMKNTFDEGSRVRSRKIEELLETVELQNLELQKLRRKGQIDLQQTKQKLSNIRYK